MQKVLIVEDEEQLLNLLHATLAKKHAVLDARNGVEGLDIALKEHPDLILLDIKMPKMDGWKMLEQLRKDDYGKNVKIIILTNLDTDNRAISRVVEEQPIAYWVKSDVKILEIANKIESLLADR